MSLHTPVTHTRENPPERAPEERAGAKDHVLAFLAACGIAGPVWFVVTWIVAGLLYRGYNQLTQATSELTSRGAPLAVTSIANFGLMVLGLCMIAFAFGLYRGVRRSRWLLIGVILLALFGLVCMGHTFFPMDPGTGASSWQNVMHSVMYVADSVTVIPCLLVLRSVCQRCRLPGLSLVHASHAIRDGACLSGRGIFPGRSVRAPLPCS